MEFRKKESGWKLPQRYETDVLVGNWYEDRMEFSRGSHTDVNSTYRTRFSAHDGGQRDLKESRTQRLGSLLRNDGLPPQTLVHHHGKAFVDGLAVTTYDQDFTRSAVDTQPRVWDKWHTQWKPEKSDFPIKGLPTHTGALERMKEKWRKQEEEERKPDLTSTKQRSFRRHDPIAFTASRYATPKEWSSHLHPHIQNKHMTLRGKPSMVVVERGSLPEISPATFHAAGTR